MPTLQSSVVPFAAPAPGAPAVESDFRQRLIELQDQSLRTRDEALRARDETARAGDEAVLTRDEAERTRIAAEQTRLETEQTLAEYRAQQGDEHVAGEHPPPYAF
jgi:hypothetical protein